MTRERRAKPPERSSRRPRPAPAEHLAGTPLGADRVRAVFPGEVPGEERLQKFLARAGVASRRQCEALIQAGRVQVNDVVVQTLGSRVRPSSDRVRVDGELVRTESPLTILLHKPAGYITSRADPQGRPVVTSLVAQANLPRLYPVGRLDWDTEGLLLLTNDGALANALTHPRYAVRKVYHAKLKGYPSPGALGLFTRGVTCDGEPLRALAVEVLHSTRQNTWVAITLEQGRYRQIRRMGEAIGHPVLKLTRVALGPLKLGSLPRGQWRLLSSEELRSLYALVPGPGPSKGRG